MVADISYQLPPLVVAEVLGIPPEDCLGASLARKELEIAFRILLERLPGLRLDEAHPPQLKSHNLMFRGFESLHVRW